MSLAGLYCIKVKEPGGTRESESVNDVLKRIKVKASEFDWLRDIYQLNFM
jgi:hypothetical protein